MIELLWIAIAALGCWNVYYEIRVRTLDANMRGLKTLDKICEEWGEIYNADSAAMAERWASHDSIHDTILEVARTTTDAMQRIDDRAKEEITHRENLERLLGEHVSGPHPIVLNMEAVYQAMCNRAAMECDPDSIIRQAEGKDWEGGCGDH